LRNLTVIKPHSIDKEKKNGARKRPPKMEDTLSGLNQNQVRLGASLALPFLRAAL
jgi:hypothetical protein